MKKRPMAIKTSLKFAALLLASSVLGQLGYAEAAAAPAKPTQQSSQNRPNLVLFLVDDLGWQDTSVPFHSEMTPLNRKYQTPNLERLAAEGVKFTQAYACAVCSPSRVSLMTGWNAARHRVTNWTLHKDRSSDHPHPRLEFPAWNVNGLSPSPGVARTVTAPTLPELLRRAGYRTIHVGKAHFGAVGTPGEDPRNLGFDVNLAGHGPGGPGSYLGTQNFSAAWRMGSRAWDVPGLEAYHGQDVFLTDVLTREAIQQIDRAVADQTPFFLYLAHYAVHVPFAADARFYQKYRDTGLDQTEAMYAALVEGMDQSLGEIIATLQRHAIADQTIILFMSDNGGLSAHGRGGEPHTHNRPLSSGKGSAHEGGVRVPMVVRWPGVTQPATVCQQPVLIEDFFPSLLEMAGVQDLPQSDGRSFVPLLRGEKPADRERAFVWHFPNNWGPTGPGIGAYSAIRKGDWKLIYYHDPEREHRYELFNLANDLGERHNLAESQAATRARLAGELAEQLRQMEAQMPTDRRTGEPVALPQ